MRDEDTNYSNSQLARATLEITAFVCVWSIYEYERWPNIVLQRELKQSVPSLAISNPLKKLFKWVLKFQALQFPHNP